MNLEDYEAPDPYAPRAKASQTVAAAKRRTTNDERRTTDDAPKSVRQYLPFSIGAAVLIMLMIGAASYQLSRLPDGRPLAITPSVAQAFEKDPVTAPVASPEAPAATIAPKRTIGAYAAPDGVLLGQIETTRRIHPVAHYGAGWIAYQDGAGLVWVRASDRPDLALTGPDLAPVAAPQTGQWLSQYPGDQADDWTPPEATAEPSAPPAAAPTATIVWATSGPVNKQDFAQPDIKQTCQFVGCLGQNAVDLARAQACHALYWQYRDIDPETISEPDLSAVRGCIWEGLYR